MERAYDLTKCFRCSRARLPEDNSDDIESCDHYCSACSENHIGHFFGSWCIYCILDGKKWLYEWDSFEEISRDLISLGEYGEEDAAKYSKPYSPSKETYAKNMADVDDRKKNPWGSDFRSQTHVIADLYEKGFAFPTIYCIYTAEIDGDGYLHWNHEASASTLEKAKAFISTWPQTKMTWNKLHPELNAENNWTFVGTRAEFQTKYNQEEVNSTITEYWGVVIEAQPLLI